VFRSWNNDRAIYYRKQNRIPDDIGTAVNVQAMVFGNRGETSGTGVGFTRNPATGEHHFYGEFLLNAQGEDVVAGVRTPQPIDELSRVMPDTFRQLRDITSRLEHHYRDVQDFEFTIEDGKLFLLQTRNGKRTAHAAVRIAGRHGGGRAHHA
jgi:pyruvate,orthophosphate dikinase